MTRIVRKTLPRVHPFEADEWLTVKSSNVAALGLIGHDLIVEFNDGSAYRYRGAGDHYHTAICASSVGSYFHKWIRPRYKCQKLRGKA